MEEEEAAEGAPAWMATFADLMSLLLTFFVLLLSFASVDVMKFEGMIGSMRDAFGVKYEDPGIHVALKDSMLQMFDKEAISDVSTTQDEKLKGRLRKMIKHMQIAGSVDVESGKRGIVVRVEGDLMFEAGQANVSPRAFVLLDEMAAVLSQFNHDVSVEGHTDSARPGKSYPSNFHLSSMRALSALEYLVEVAGLDPKRMSAVGYGDAKPLAKNTTKKNRAKNRRVEFAFHRVGK